MTEEILYQMSYKWAVHMWCKMDLKLRKNPEDRILQEREKKAWEIILQIEQEAKEKGYTLQVTGSTCSPSFFFKKKC